MNPTLNHINQTLTLNLKIRPTYNWKYIIEVGGFLVNVTWVFMIKTRRKTNSSNSYNIKFVKHLEIHLEHQWSGSRIPMALPPSHVKWKNPWNCKPTLTSFGRSWDHLDPYISFTISSSLEIKIKPSIFKEKSFEGLKGNIFQVPKWK